MKVAEIDTILDKKLFSLPELIGFIKNIEEKQIRKNEILESEAMKKFGVVDTATALLAKNNNLHLITMDWDLRDWCKSNDIPCLHLEELYFYLH